MDALLQAFSISSVGFTAIFVVSFVSATLLPMATEPVLFAFVSLNPHQFWWAIIVATIGNTMGGMLTYFMGLGSKQVYVQVHKKHGQRHRLAEYLYRKIGTKALFFSFLPIVGDLICVLAGWFQLPWKPVLFWMTLGKFVRFVVLTSVLLYIPSAFWQQLYNHIKTLIG